MALQTQRQDYNKRYQGKEITPHVNIVKVVFVRGILVEL